MVIIKHFADYTKTTHKCKYSLKSVNMAEKEQIKAVLISEPMIALLRYPMDRL
jgi:hypothetical protein